MVRVAWSSFARVIGGALLIGVPACSSGGDEPRENNGAQIGEIGTISERLGSGPGDCTSATFGSEIYYFCSDAQSWTAARTKCLSVPGLDLVRIDSAAENAFVASKAAGVSWLSANDRTAEGAWRWSAAGADAGPQFWSGNSNGSPVGGLYANWEPGQPNDLGTQDCAALESDAKWDDKSCGDTKSYVCEGDACPSDPSKLEPGVCGCGVSDADTDGDGRPDCFDLCPEDPFKVEPGDCGCSNAPAAAGTSCDDGLCATSAQCNGAGTCGNPTDCAPAAGCAFQRYAGEGGRGYFFCPGPVDWPTAKTQCEGRPGMALVRIDDTAENGFVRSKLTTASWLGANDRVLEGTWMWAQPETDRGDQFWTGGASGHSVNGLFASWKSGQPDDSGNADCGRMDPVNAGNWDDASCTAIAGYVCEVTPDQCSGSQAGAPWPSTRRCAAHDARSTGVGSQTSEINWATALSGATPVGSPSVGADGTIYVAVATKVFAVSDTGSVKWSFTAGGSIDSTPALGTDGTVYFGASNEHVYGLSPSGAKLFEQDLLHPIHSSPVTASDRTLYVSNGDDLHALQPNAVELWHKDVGDSDGLSPAVGPHRTIYIGSRLLNRMTAFSPGGEQLWTFDPGAAVGTTAAVSQDGVLYFGAGNSVFAVKPAGTQKWKYSAGALVKASPAIGPDGTVYTASNNGVVHAIVGATGAARWTRAIAGTGASSPAVDSLGNVYVGASDGKIYALKPTDGSTSWTTTTGGAVTTAPAIGVSGTVYAGSADGKLYSIGGGPTPFVNCVSQVGAGRYNALFGYENRQTVPAVVPLGPQNKLTPSPTLATVAPPTTFAPGRTEIGFWVPMSGPSVTWELRGRSVTASTASPVCTAAAFPQSAASVPGRDPEGHGQVAGDRPKLYPYSNTTAASSAMGSGIGTVRQGLNAAFVPPGFRVSVTDCFVRNDACGGFGAPYVKVKIGDGPVQQQDCPVNDTCALFGGCPVFDEPSISINATSVPVAIQLWEHDNFLCGGDDDFLMDLGFTVDNVTGAYTGSGTGVESASFSGPDGSDLGLDPAREKRRA